MRAATLIRVCSQQLNQGGMCLHQEEQMNSQEGTQGLVINLPGSQTCREMGILEIQTRFKPNGEQNFFQTKEARNELVSKLKIVGLYYSNKNPHKRALWNAPWLYPIVPSAVCHSCQCPSWLTAKAPCNTRLQNRTAAQGTLAAITQTVFAFVQFQVLSEQPD